MLKLARTHPHAARRSRLYITAWAAVAVAATTFSTSRIQKIADVKSFHAPHGARPITPYYRSFAESRGGVVSVGVGMSKDGTWNQTRTPRM